MRTYSRTSQFKKDVKLAAKRGKDLSKLKHLMELLIGEKILSSIYRDHALQGEFSGSRDCHIEPDWILVYSLEDGGKHVRFERTGTHSDLFR